MNSTSSKASQPVPTQPFGPVHVIDPQRNHTHTVITLHGRGSNGEEFAAELMESKLSDQATLVQRFPNFRWVFPTSQILWSSMFREDISVWFEAYSLTNDTTTHDSKAKDITNSVAYLETILKEETTRLGGIWGKIILGGISQGGAIGMWTLLHSKSFKASPGAFFGISTWLPYASNVETLLGQDAIQTSVPGSSEPKSSQTDMFMPTMMTAICDSLTSSRLKEKLLDTPVFLGHGVDDAYVDIELGRQARRIFARIGLTVEWKEYHGAEQEGHWLKLPDEVDDIARFLARCTVNA